MGAEHNMARRIQLRRDTAANWSSTNPTLAQGEIGIDLTNNKIKIGTGTSAWNSLAYWDDQETAAIGSFEFAGNVITTTDSSNVIIDQAVEIKSDLTVAGNLEPTINLNSSLGSPTKQWKDIFVSEGSVYIGDIKLSNDDGTLLVQKVTDPGQVTEQPVPGSTGTVTTDRLVVGDVELILTGGANPYVTFPAITGGDQLLIQGAEISSISGDIALTSKGNLTVISNAEGLRGGSLYWQFNAQGDIELPNKWPIQFTAVFDAAHYVGGGTFQGDGTASFNVELQGDGATFEWLADDPTFETNRGYIGQQSFRYTEADHGITGFNVDILMQMMGSGPYSLQIAISPPPGVADLSNIRSSQELMISADTKGWLFDINGDIYLPAGGDIRDSIGNSVLGGAAGPVQPYLELTDTPFITQPAILGTPVTVTVPLSGINALVQVDILEGPVLGGITVSQAGSGYIPGTTYKIYSYQIGGSNDATDSITFTIDTVNESGGILTVANAAFTGVATNNSAGYGNVSIDYQPVQIFDEISPGLTLTRDLNQGIYNSAVELEYDNSTYLSPLGTEWNSDGWGDLTGIGTRSYVTWRQALNNQVGNNIVASELVMHDIVNDKYYKFDFTAWGGNNGGYSYTRTEVTDPNYFRKEDYATANNVDVIEDDSTIQIGITRGENNGIYNPFTEEGWNENVSPQGTEWNIDGWNDLSDVETRTYTNLYAAFGNGGLGNKIVGTECVMYVPSIEKYYAIKFLSWTQGNAGGGFSYTRKEIDLTQLNEGVKFSDGTILKSASGIGRIKSTAPGNRRIEEVTGYNQVSVTPRVTNSLTTVASRAGSNTFDIWVDITSTTIDDVINNPGNYNNAYNFEFSIDNNNWYRWQGSQGFDGNERAYSISPTLVSYNQGDTIYFRYNTGAEPVVWWDKADLPGSSGNFRGAIIDYHAWTGESTIIGTIHIVDDDGEEHISHQEVQSGSTDGENDDLWLVTTEGQIKYRRIDGESKTLKIHWTAKVFYGSEYYDD